MKTTYLTISEVASRCGVATSALRFYEERGLISSERTEGNQRRYNRATLRRISLIRVAQSLGLTLREISDALALLPHSRAPTKKDWERLSKKWRHHLDGRISHLQQMRDRLTSCIGCGCLSLRVCSLYNAKDHVASQGDGPRILIDAMSETK